MMDEVETVLRYGAEGIGLFRSEFDYFNRDHIPDEDMLTSTYSELLSTLAPMPVTIRTLDVGGDKFYRIFLRIEFVLILSAILPWAYALSAIFFVSRPCSGPSCAHYSGPRSMVICAFFTDDFFTVRTATCQRDSPADHGTTYTGTDSL